MIPVKHGLHFHGAVLPLRDPYRKFCLLEHQESRCHLQQNSRCSLGSFTCRRLHMLALGSAAGSSATDACRAAECCWKPDSSVNLILWAGGMAEAVLLLTALWESPWKLLPVGSSVEGIQCAFGNGCVTISFKLSVRNGPCGWLCQNRNISKCITVCSQHTQLVWQGGAMTQ